MSRDVSCMKRIDYLLKTVGMKFKFKKLEICFHKRQVSFLVVKAVKCKRSIKKEKYKKLNLKRHSTDITHSLHSICFRITKAITLSDTARGGGQVGTCAPGAGLRGASTHFI